MVVGGNRSHQAVERVLSNFVGPGDSWKTTNTWGRERLLPWQKQRLYRRTFCWPQRGSSKPFRNSGRESRAWDFWSGSYWCTLWILPCGGRGTLKSSFLPATTLLLVKFTKGSRDWKLAEYLGKSCKSFPLKALEIVGQSSLTHLFRDTWTSGTVPMR